jgi:predicted dehydrogenase
VGLGRISKRHIESLGELFGKAKLVAAAEVIEVKRTAADLGAERVYASASEMLENHPELDLVSILTESGSHYSIAMEILGWGKPVLIEKPLALSIKDATSLVDAYSSARVPLFVVKQNRLNPPIQELFRLIEDKSLGNLTFVSASVMWARDSQYYLQDKWRLSRQLDGGVVWNQASHYVDLLSLVLGDVSSVFAYGANFLSPAETEDTVFALLKSSSGQLGSLQATTTIRPKNFEGSITASGDKGLVRVGGHALNEFSGSTIDGFDFTTSPAESQDKSQVYGQSHARLYMEIAEDLGGGKPSQFRASESLQVIAVMEAIHKSIDEGREIQLSEVWSS